MSNASSLNTILQKIDCLIAWLKCLTDCLTPISVYATIIGFIITVIMLREIWIIKQRFMCRARLPQMISDLEKTSASLNSSMPKWPEHRNAASIQIKNAVSLMISAEKMTPSTERKRIKTVRKKLDKASKHLLKSPYDKDDPIWDLYGDITAIITSLKELNLSTKWE